MVVSDPRTKEETDFHFDKSLIGEFQRRRKKSYDPHLDSRRSAASDQQQE